uniref:Uncharacterized protein n=1 Tax=viral metagenome TaxID=1070528 RepID=A0A6C0ITH7_9ZZZZ
MVNHTCNRCGYTTYRKQNLKTHLLKKYTCQPLIDETSICDILKLHGFDEEAITYENVNDCKSNVNLKCKPIYKSKLNIHITESDSNICPNCKKIFSCRQAKYKHLKYNCNILKLTEEQLNDKNELQKNHDALVIQVEKLMNEVAILKTKNISNISNKTNNINKGIVNNIVINNYGSENIDYITFSRFVKLLETPLSAISKLIELKYFNEKHPENHNIKITNIHDKFAKIYKDKKWLVSNKKDIIQELVENGYADFEEFKDLNEEELTNKIKERYKKMEKYYTDNFGELYKQSEMSIINGTNKSE